jgi:hypothetical protein
MLTGHCECGRVKFEVDGDIKDFSHCHCSQCRRLHGAAYATFAGVAKDAFRYVSGDSDIKSYWSSEKNERVFCGNCGSNIMVISNTEPDSCYLSMSAIEGDPPRPEGYHIFVGSVAPWHEITDELQKFEKWES